MRAASSAPSARPAATASRAAVRFVALIVSVACGLSCSGCLYARVLYYNSPSLSAADYFDSRTIAAAPEPLPLRPAKREATFPVPQTLGCAYGSFDELLEANETGAFVMIHDDRVIYERYFGDISETSALADFSMTKTFAALLVGCAIEDGMIGSVDQRLTELIPDLAPKPGYGDVTVDHLLRMTSGIDFDEESVAGAALYYTTDLRGRLYDYDVKWTPGTRYLYGSVSTQILWDVLKRRLGQRTVSSYFEERVWARLGAEQPAKWSLDSASNGVEKFFGGFSATARDHARLGLLYLNRGTFANRTVVSEQWVTQSLTRDPVAGVVHTADGWVERGKYQWFLTRDGRAFFAKGFHGQYVFVVPAKKLVLVRFGEGYGDIDWVDLFLWLSDRV